MKKGISLHIGLNYVDSVHYSGWEGKLIAAEYDANDMFLITKSQGLTPSKLLSEEATREAVISAIKKASATLKEDDLFVLTYSGHGGQLPDLNSDDDDGLDETWCLFDGELIDDELYSLWSDFKAGVRILVFSDSCHSGSVVRVARRSERPDSELTPKFLPAEIASNTYFNNKERYDKLLTGVKKVNPGDIPVSVKLISGCMDNQSSYDGPFNGQFTAALKRIWNGGKFSGNYESFHKKIMALLPSEQTPNYLNIGQPNKIFDSQKPFTI